jgi:hypothetical protein
MSSNTSSNQNEPSGYINISAAIRATFNCCLSTSNIRDVNNNKSKANHITGEDNNSEDVEINTPEEKGELEDVINIPIVASEES